MNYFSKNIIFLNKKVSCKEEAISIIADSFLDKGLVYEDFETSILERERLTPTGLQLEKIGVAIPHTEIDKVIEPQIGFMSLLNPIKFGDMVDPNNEIEVKMLFMLAMNNPDEQVSMLQSLMNLFQDSEMIEDLIKCETEEQFKSVIKRAF